MPAGPVREALVVSCAILVYFGVRNLTAGSADTAFANARHLISLEDALGIGWEDALQSVTLRSDLLVDAANWVYIWGHWPVILGAAVGLGWVPCEGEGADALLASRYDIEVAGVRVPAEASLRPIYDPHGGRTRA